MGFEQRQMPLQLQMQFEHEATGLFVDEQVVGGSTVRGRDPARSGQQIFPHALGGLDMDHHIRRGQLTFDRSFRV